MLDVKSWLTATVSALIQPRGARSGPDQPGSSTPNATIQVFMAHTWQVPNLQVELVQPPLENARTVKTMGGDANS